jgi:hypothetical protein
MYSGFNKTMIGLHVIVACVLVALLTAWVLDIWDAGATFAWLRERMAETRETFGEFGKALLELF